MTAWDDQTTLTDSPDRSVAEHVRRYLETAGEDGYMEGGMTNLVLTTVGRRTGRLRRTGLFFTEDDGPLHPRRLGCRGQPSTSQLVPQRGSQPRGAGPNSRGEVRRSGPDRSGRGADPAVAADDLTRADLPHVRGQMPPSDPGRRPGTDVIRSASTGPRVGPSPLHPRAAIR